ncbi:helix-turn-helix domain-containing protein [Sphingopyxis sp. NFH-91]|uniref:helix-turn-helix domain-containing protein n=1 Tax=Sphingopyxis sp. NFH-91 TaxID=2744457 RepID=UPI001F2BC1F2|nr:helix-turn-helix domain-containing protein [Sphingopyxis sp. NFH-91]
MQHNAPEKLAYSIQEAVAATSISKSNLYEKIARGEIPATKVGRRTVIPASALRRLVGA